MGKLKVGALYVGPCAAESSAFGGRRSRRPSTDAHAVATFSHFPHNCQKIHSPVQ